jgi:hypothetical protein
MNTAMDVRGTLLAVLSEQSPPGQVSDLQSIVVLREVARRLGAVNNPSLEQAILTAFHDLFRTGYLAWGFNLTNPNPPFLHVTEVGRRTLEKLSRDPGNPEGYFAHIAHQGKLDPIAAAYLHEAIACYANALPRATAVMVGGAAERLTLEIAEVLKERYLAAGEQAPRGLSDWRIRAVLANIAEVLDSRRQSMPHTLREEYSAYWPAFTQQIRAVRNEAGHPESLEPISMDSVHASLLIFPELARLAGSLRDWIGGRS